MLRYIDFYKRFGIRRADQIIKPPLPMIERMMLPNASIVHYIPSSVVEIGPNEDYFLFNKNKKPFRIEHIVELGYHEGNPRKVPLDPMIKVRAWKREHQRFKPMVDIETAKKDATIIVVENYAPINQAYRYPKTINSAYYRTSNYIRTVFDNIDRLSKNGYQQYLQFPLPKFIPPLTELNLASTNLNTALMKKYADPQLYFLLQMWIWLGPHRERGMMSHILNRCCNEINLVICENSRWSVLNLGVLNTMRAATKTEIETWEEAVKTDPSLPEPNRKGAIASAVQKRFLRMLMGIMDARQPEMEERLGDEIIEASSDISTTDSSLVPEEQQVKEYQTSLSSSGKETDLTKDLLFDEGTDQKIELDLETLQEIQDNVSEAQLMQEISPSDEISVSALNQAQVSDDTELTPQDIRALEKDAVTGFTAPDNVSGNFKRLVARAADEGYISANEYRKLNEDATRIEHIEFRGEKLADFIKVDPAKLKITERPTIPDADTIIDKSMLTSTLMEFNSRYVRNVMERDIAGMVVNLQNAGYCVLDFTATDVSNITGERTEYAVKYKPIVGEPTTIRFMLPKVDDEGVFEIGGTKYRTRYMRGDLPIRKVNPGRVALSSYYGNKIFVDRTERRVGNYNKWVKQSLLAKVIDTTPSCISDAVPGSAFEPDKGGVRDFTILAQSFRSLDLTLKNKTFHCQFYASKMKEVYSKESLAWAKANKSTLVGISNKGEILSVDDNHQWYILQNNTATPVGTLEEIFELDVTKAPIEFAELQVFSKTIPLGLVLGYMMGFKALLAKLKIKPRIVPRGERSNLAPDEWKISFDDETWVFDRKDTMACMIFGGLRDYKDIVSQFPVGEFDRKDVYFNVLESKKMGVSYLREMDNLESLFIDPITRELLKEMKEPVIFRDLIIRCAQLLCTDQHPHELDTHYMRIKGYERFSGILYEELVKSVRSHNSRPGKGRYGLEVNPYNVWMTIQKDPAKDQISEINPIQNLKEQEAVTFSGIGGRSSRSMVKRTRVYPKSDEGIISESTVDSSDVAINVFTSANPLFNSLRGTADTYNFKENGPTSLISTSALLSPSSTKDD